MRLHPEFSIKRMVGDEMQKLFEDDREELKSESKKQLLKVQAEKRKTYNMQPKIQNLMMMISFSFKTILKMRTQCYPRRLKIRTAEMWDAITPRRQQRPVKISYQMK